MKGNQSGSIFADGWKYIIVDTGQSSQSGVDSSAEGDYFSREFRYFLDRSDGCSSDFPENQKSGDCQCYCPYIFIYYGKRNRKTCSEQSQAV